MAKYSLRSLWDLAAVSEDSDRFSRAWGAGDEMQFSIGQAGAVGSASSVSISAATSTAPATFGAGALSPIDPLATHTLPDLVFDNVEINGDPIDDGDEYGPNFRPGDTVRLDWDVDNIGGGSAVASRVAIRLISDVDGMTVDTNSTDAISAGGSDTGQWDTFTIPATLSPGLYGIELVADEGRVVSESNESNNTYLILIRVDPPGKADLVVDDVEINGGPVPAGGQHELVVRAGDQISLLWDVDNLGNGSAPSSRVGIYLSGGGETIRVDSAATDALSAGSSDNNTTDSFTLFSTLESGVYEIELRADYESVVSESNESNNSYKFSIRVEGATPEGDQVREGTDTQHSLITAARVSGAIDAEPISGDGTVSDLQGGMVDKDWYKVTLDPGKVYTFDATTSITTGRVVISLYDPTETRVKGPVEGSAPSFTFDMTNQTNSKIYYLAVSAGGDDPVWRTATGSYSIGMSAGAAPPTAADDYRDEDTDTSSPLGGISLLAPVQTGKIGPADANDTRGDKDVFKVTLTQGQTYVFTMTGASVDGFSPLSQSIFTIRKAGSFTTIEATSTEGSNAVMEFFAQSGGDYYIRTGSGGPTYTTDQGGYRLEMRAAGATAPAYDPGSTIESALPISFTAGAYTYSGRVGDGDPSDLFKVTAPAAGGELTVRLTELTSDIDLRFINSVEGTVAGPSREDGTQAEFLDLLLQPNQSIWIKVYPASSQQGQYTLNATLVAPEPPPASVTMKPYAALVGDFLYLTMARFMVAAYADAAGASQRAELVSAGWKFIDSSFQSTKLAEKEIMALVGADGYYENSGAGAVVARSADAVVISFRGTDSWGDAPDWIAVQTHYSLVRELVAAVERLVLEDPSLKKVFVTGHSLGAAMVDVYMRDHPSDINQGFTFAHPDVLAFIVDKTVQDSRITSFHNQSDIINFAETPRGTVPGLANSISFTSDDGIIKSHFKLSYLSATEFLAKSGITHGVLLKGLMGLGHNEFLIPGLSEGSNNTLDSLRGSLLMVGGDGSDSYNVIPDFRRAGDTIIESNGTDALWLRTAPAVSGGSLGWFQGTVRLSVSPNGRDLLIHPFQLGMFPTEYRAIRIYNYFADGGRVEWIQWGDKLLQLPAKVTDVARWNDTYFNLVSEASIQQSERPDGTTFPIVSATGGPAPTDTASFQSFKDMKATADLSQRVGNLWTNISTPPQAFSAMAAAALPEGIFVDLADIENIIGTNGGDDLTGSDVANSLSGVEGDDSLSGGLGNDYLDGGSGVDILNGGPGEDLMDGGPGADQLSGGADNDSYFIEDPADFVTEGAGEGSHDRIYTSVNYTLGSSVYVETLSTADDSCTDPLTLAGNELDNRIVGNAGANLLYGMGGIDRLEGLAGDDRYVVDQAGDLVIEAAGQGYDTVFSPISYALASGSEVEAISTLDRLGTQAIDFTGNEYGNAFYGNAGANRLSGGAGDDWLDGGNGDDRLEGGEGVDTALYWTAGAGVTVSLALLGTAQNTGGAGVDTLIDIENLFGSPFADVLTGNGFANVLDGREGADTMRGGAGDDTYYVDNAGDVVEELAGEGFDLICTTLAAYSLLGTNIERLGSSSDVAHDFRGNAGNNVISGGAGNDFLRLHDGGTDTAIGGLGNDVFLFGGTLTSGDSIDGGAGTDQVAIQGNYSGGLTFGSNVIGIENLAILPGNDTRFGDPGTNFYDYVLTTTDTTVAAGVQMVIDANRLRPGEDLTFNGSAETDGSFFIYGGAGTDLLTGGAGNDVFLFGAWDQWNPSDVITGGAGRDQLALRGNYTLTFGAGQLIGIENIGLLSAHDTRFGSLGSSYSYDLKTVDENVASGVQMTVDGAKLRIAEFFRFDGSAETDGSFRVFGGLVDDTIVGSANGDILQGHGGLDTLTGGGGGDAFRYVATSDSAPGAADRILDFLPGTDWIDLSRIDANSHAAGDQAFRWIGSGTFAGTGAGSAGELRAYQGASSWFVEGDTDGNGAADFVIEVVVVGPTPLEAGHFAM